MNISHPEVPASVVASVPHMQNLPWAGVVFKGGQNHLRVGKKNPTPSFYICDK